MGINFFRYLLLTLAITFFSQNSDFLFAQQVGPGPGGGVAGTTLTTFESEDFSGSGICALCHSSLTDEAGADVSNDAQWRSTMMANAAKDLNVKLVKGARVKIEYDRKRRDRHGRVLAYVFLENGQMVNAILLR